jgi:hypothetical protein
MPAAPTERARNTANVCFAMCLVFLSGCSGIGYPVSVSATPTAASVQINQNQSFIATVGNDNQSKGVAWALSGGGCRGATCGTLSATSSASGSAITYTAPAIVPALADVTLTATSVTDTTKSSAAKITVRSSVFVTVFPAAAHVASASGTQTFTPTLQNDAQNKGVNWVLSGVGCGGAACGALSASFSTSGVGITYSAPPSAPSPATITLKAISVADQTRSATATIALTTGPSSGLGVSLTPLRGGVPVSQSLKFVAALSDDRANAGVTWSAAGSGCSGAACGSITNVATPPAPSTSATFVAPSTPGVYTITATSVTDVTKSASATIGVTNLPGVITYHNDLSRDGVNAQEYALTTANVANTTFGKLFSCATDGAIYAQPLWVADLSIGGAQRNVVVVATQHDSLYAFDADANPCSQLWHANLIDTEHGGTSGETPVPGGPTGFLVGGGDGDISPEVGVTGTPVIDPSTNTLYVVSKSVMTSGPAFFQRLHAIDLTTGNEKFQGPVNVVASVMGAGDGASGGSVPFNPRTQNQRPGLALANGVVYVAWSAHEDQDPYHGWVLAYSAATLAQVETFSDTPNGKRGGIWMGGGAPAVDASNNLHLITGNGTFDAGGASSPNNDYGDTFLKLSSTLRVSDFFTPTDQAVLEANDLDFGSGGAAILVDQPSGPAPHLMIGGGKNGAMYVVNRDHMGRLGDSNVWQKFRFGLSIFATGAFWNNTFYLAGVGGPLTAFPLNGTTDKFEVLSSVSGTSYGFPGASPSVSATGTSNGIIWALDNSQYCTKRSPGCGPAVLHAYDATNLATELWNSSQGSGNALGHAVKFAVPTVANGKVYVGTRGSDVSSGGVGELDVYGLLPD